MFWARFFGEPPCTCNYVCVYRSRHRYYLLLYRNKSTWSDPVLSLSTYIYIYLLRNELNPVFSEAFVTNNAARSNFLLKSCRRRTRCYCKLAHTCLGFWLNFNYSQSAMTFSCLQWITFDAISSHHTHTGRRAKLITLAMTSFHRIAKKKKISKEYYNIRIKLKFRMTQSYSALISDTRANKALGLTRVRH